MAKAKRKTVKQSVGIEPDAELFLKLLLYLVVGSFWVRLTTQSGTMQIPLPVGLGIGILFARQERFVIDRKLEYAILLMAMFIGFWLPLGLGLSF